MCIAAHPDDEDGTSLIVMRRKYGAHTVSVFSTFGEGGQNAIGPELYEELGAIRARETMAAAEIQGSEPYFLGLKDFGYSKSADEAFRFWGHEEALRRMVLQIRKLRPDVIITNHSVTNNDHGHHQATARLELEAFDAAADPKRFPEQLRWDTQAWQVQRLFVRAGFGNRAPPGQTTDAETITIDPNERDPIRGTTYAEQALQALQKHATQGPWPKTIADMARFRNSPDGKLPLIRYRLAREAKDVAPLPNESHTFADGLRLPDHLAQRLAPPTIDGRPLTDFVGARDRILAALLETAKQHLQSAPDVSILEHWRLLRMGLRFDAALAAASGLSAKLIPREDVVYPGSKSTADFVISISGSTQLQPSSIIFGQGYTDGHVIMHAVRVDRKAAGSNDTSHNDIGYELPPAAALTVPHSAHLYDGLEQGYPLAASARFNIGNVSFGLQSETSVDVAAAVEVTAITPQAAIASTQDQRPSFTLQITNHQNKEFRGRVIPRVVAPCESIACNEAAFEGSTFLRGHRSSGATLRLAPNETAKVKLEMPSIPLSRNGTDGGPRPTSPYRLVFRTEKQSRNGDWETVGESIPVVVSYAGARVAPNLQVGYIRGFDYSLPNGLAALGVESKELSVDEVKTADLQKYSAIIVDNRVYESQPGLIAANQRLLDYAKGGGTLIVFYHKSFEWNPDPRRNRPQLAPYPITLGDERITDENAPITFIEPQHPLLNSPNKIGQEDFAGWIQERGLYYPKDWDAHYQALFASNDPGEAPLRGGLLAADYGRGHYIYTSMVWYRQLRAGVPGAYRMLANMISYGRPAP